MPIEKTCLVSGKKFTITDDDLAFYKKMNAPTPTLCPEERRRQRFSWRNERKFYHRTCDATGSKILSIYDSNYPGSVYSPKAYFSDDWQAKDYGRDFDFSRPFFEQFKALFLATPQMSLVHIGSDTMENSDYTNDVMRIRDGYLLFDGEQARDSMFGETFLRIDSCLDFLFLEDSQFCYECVNCRNGYELFYSINALNCQQSWFLQDCVGCKDCFGCRNLYQKQYCVYNQQYTKAEYEKFIASFDFGSYKNIEKLKEDSSHFWKTQAVKFYHGQKVENAFGDYLLECKDCLGCYDCNQLRDCKYCTNLLCGANDCQDYDVWGNNAQWVYDALCCGEGVNNVKHSYYVSHNAQNMTYCAYCLFGVKDCFGCVGLQKAEYCILNKQYSKEKYEALVPKIIEHMKGNGEWGQFFPAQLSPFAYNETIAQEHFELTEKECLARGYSWKTQVKPDLMATNFAIPDNISALTETVCDEILSCQVSGKPYRITKPELDFYKKMNIPVPRLCPDQRYLQRLKLRNPKRLYERVCDNCKSHLKTTYAPDRTEKIYCEDCYQKLVV